MFVRFGRISWAEGLHTILYKISRTDYSWRERLSAKNHLSKTNLQGGHKKLQFVSWMLATLKIKHRAAPVILRLVKSFSIRLLFTKNLNGLSEDWFVPHCIFRLFTFSVPTFFKNKKFVNYKIEKLCLITERKRKAPVARQGKEELRQFARGCWWEVENPPSELHPIIVRRSGPSVARLMPILRRW